MSRIEVIAPNLKFRLSGVTSTIVQLVPVQARTIGIATIGPGLPDSLPKMRWWQLPRLLGLPASRRRRIWHARRNTEMVMGLVLRTIFRAPMHLLFTSAAQRSHQPFTKWLIGKMDAVIATSARSGSYLDVPHDGGDARHRPRPVPSAARRRGRFCGLRTAGPLCGRLLRADQAAEGHRPLRRRDDRAVAAVSGLDRGHRRTGDGREPRLCASLEGQDRQSRPVGPDRVSRRSARRETLVPPPVALCGAVAQRRFWADPAGGDGLADAGGRQRRRRLCRDGRSRRDGRRRARGRRQGADRRDQSRTSPTRRLPKTHGRQALAHVQRHFPLSREAEGVAKVYDRLWARR